MEIEYAFLLAFIIGVMALIYGYYIGQSDSIRLPEGTINPSPLPEGVDHVVIPVYILNRLDKKIQGIILSVYWKVMRTLPDRHSYRVGYHNGSRFMKDPMLAKAEENLEEEV
jgi:hypothetical protein